MHPARTPRNRSVLCVLVIILLSTASAQAKVPPSSIATQSRPAVKNEPFAITVRFVLTGVDSAELGEERTGLGEELTGHVAAYPGTRLILAEEIPITLRRVGEGVYRGEVIFPTAGTWRIWTMPHISDRQGLILIHTNFVEIEVLNERPPEPPTTAIIVGAVLGLGIVLLTMQRRRWTPTAGMRRGREGGSQPRRG